MNVTGFEDAEFIHEGIKFIKIIELRLDILKGFADVKETDKGKIYDFSKLSYLVNDKGVYLGFKQDK